MLMLKAAKRTLKRTATKLLFGKKYTDLVYEDYYNRGNIYCDCKENKKASQFYIAKSVSYYDAMIYYCKHKNYVVKEMSTEIFAIGDNTVKVTIDDIELKFELSRNMYYTKKACLDCNKCVGWFDNSNRMIISPLYEMERLICTELKIATEKKEKQELAEKICNVKNELDSDDVGLF